MHWPPPISKFVLISLLCPNNGVKFGYSLTKCDICGQRDISEHYQICSISQKKNGGFPQSHVKAPLLRYFPKTTKPLNVSTNTPQYNVTRALSVLSYCKQQYRNVTSCTGSYPCNSKVSGQCSTWMIRQLSGFTACTTVRRTRHSSPTNGYKPPTVRNSFRFFQQLSNP